jgi:hypothetical protein
MHHGPTAPSQRVDIAQRYLTWFDRWLSPNAPPRVSAGGTK